MVFDWMARRIVGGLHLNKFYLATFVWPNLDASAIDRLSRLAARMIKLSPRAPNRMGTSILIRELNKEDLSNEARAAYEVEVEREVAVGFQLESDMLRRIFSTERNDRRGFWRYFDAHPSLLSAVKKMIGNYSLDVPSGILHREPCSALREALTSYRGI
jgi:hypothetical protein